MDASTLQDALCFAYLYGYPVYAYAQYVKTIVYAKLNVAYPFRNLATPDNRAVVRPNVDMLYTPLFYDVSRTDLEFVIPEIEDRYWLWPWVSKPGRYLLRYTEDNFGVQTEGVEGGYLAYVNSPTPYAMLLNRILVKYRTPEDLAKVHSIQDSMAFTPVSRPTGPHKEIPPLDLPAMLATINDSTPETLATSILTLLATLHPHNPSIVCSDRESITRTLMLAGLSFTSDKKGTFTQPENTSLFHAVSIAEFLAATSRQSPGLSEKMGNSWTQPAAAVSGDFGSRYAARMFSAQRGYLILTRDQAAYPAYMLPGKASGSYRFAISRDGAYILTFTTGPPCRRVYNLGDRSGLVDLHGKALALTHDTLGEGEARQVFKILIQAADVRPPEEWVRNWLPAPAGSGVFMISFRFYGSCQEMLDGGWVYPVVEKVGAVRG
ncbi:hypothetical protein BJX62DRAFT_253608 [Aspergillus germanicus]